MPHHGSSKYRTPSWSRASVEGSVDMVFGDGVVGECIKIQSAEVCLSYLMAPYGAAALAPLKILSHTIKARYLW